jgi:hypothetical protein
MIKFMNKALETLVVTITKPAEEIVKAFTPNKPKGDDVRMAKYILIEDKNLESDGTIFEVLEETSKQFVINYNGTKAWINKESARILPDRFEPFETVIPSINIPQPGPFETEAMKEMFKSVWAPKIEEADEKITEEAKNTTPNGEEVLNWIHQNGGHATTTEGKRVGKTVTIDTRTKDDPDMSPMEIPDEGYLEEWPTLDKMDWENTTITADKIQSNAVYSYQGDITTWETDPRTIAMSKDNDRLRAIEKGLRKRSKEKGLSNYQLDRRCQHLEKTIKELNRDQDGLIEDNNKLKAKEAELIDAINEAEKICHRLENTIKEMDRDQNGLIEDNNKLKEKNAELIDVINEAEKTILHQKERLQNVKADRDEYKRLNDHHREQVDIGNERREKMKYTVESLHEQLHAKNEKIQSLTAEHQMTIKEAAMYKRIVEAMTMMILKK